MTWSPSVPSHVHHVSSYVCCGFCCIDGCLVTSWLSAHVITGVVLCAVTTQLSSFTLSFSAMFFLMFLNTPFFLFFFFVLLFIHFLGGGREREVSFLFVSIFTFFFFFLGGGIHIHSALRIWRAL